MAQQEPKLQCRPPDEVYEQVREYERRHGHEYTSEAVEELVRVGLREQRRPLLSRWREQIINWAGLLGVFALVFLAGGIATPAISAYNGYLMAVVLAAMAGGLVGVLEGARVVTGQSELGEFVRRRVRQ